MSLRRWMINYNLPVTAGVFVLGCYLYASLSATRIPGAALSRERNKVMTDAREVISGELTETVLKREIFFNLNASASLDLNKYWRTNSLGVSEYDFDALSSALVINCYRSVPHLSNKVDIFDALIDAGRMQGLQMAREIIDEIQKQHR